MSNFGFTPQEWLALKNEAKEILIACAKRPNGTISYSDLASKLTVARLEARDQRLFHLLGEISEEENAAGRGMLSVIVVHKSGDMQPGPGFFELAKKLGRNTTDILKCWIEELNDVRAYWSSK